MKGERVQVAPGFHHQAGQSGVGHQQIAATAHDERGHFSTRGQPQYGGEAGAIVHGDVCLGRPAEVHGGVACHRLVAQQGTETFQVLHEG